jgi:glycerol-3-phosphate acyltransferase PlsX
MSTVRGKFGALLIRPAARGMRRRFDPDTYGGAHLIGLRGTVVIAHGNSNRRAVCNAIHLAARGAEHDVVGRIAARLTVGDAARTEAAAGVAAR